MGCKSRRRGQGRRWIFAISADKVKLSADLVDKCILDEVELAASKDALNSNTKKLFNITNLTEVVELNKLLFKLLEILLVVRMIQDNNIVYVEEENNSVIHLKA
jgi:DNA polymerase II large subunit